MANEVLKEIHKVDRTVADAFGRKKLTIPSVADPFFKWMPFATVFLADIAGVKTTSRLIPKIKIIILSEVLLNGFIQPIKEVFHRRRPGKLFKHNSFPSRHTATSFCGAQILYEEVKDDSPVTALMGYSFAVTTATLRLNKKKHWFSDVVAGALIGIASAKLSYFIYKKADKRRRSYNLDTKNA